jgi:hypothetical protein
MTSGGGYSHASGNQSQSSFLRKQESFYNQSFLCKREFKMDTRFREYENVSRVIPAQAGINLHRKVTEASRLRILSVIPAQAGINLHRKVTEASRLRKY